MKKPLVIGIAGGSGSGKSTLIDELRKTFDGIVTVLLHDNYYRSHDELTFEERARLNYDEPAAFDNELFVEHLEKLHRGEGIDCPVYDYRAHARKAETIPLTASPVILTDGILIFADETLRSLFDLRIYVDTDADLRFIRRLKRDTEERGRSMESVIEQYIATVKPMHERYVEPTKQFAHIIVPENLRNPMAPGVIESYIRAYLAK